MIDINGGGSPENLMISGPRSSANSISFTLSNDHANVPVCDQCDQVYSGTTAYTVKRLAIAAGGSGDNQIIAAVTSKKLRVLALALIAEGPVSLYLKNATDGPIFGGSTNKVSLVEGGVICLPYAAFGWCQTGTANEALVMNLSGAVSVAGSIVYIEV